jgi:hypothetical protein
LLSARPTLRPTRPSAQPACHFPGLGLPTGPTLLGPAGQPAPALAYFAQAVCFLISCLPPCRSRRPVAPLGWAARPWPSRHFSRPCMAGRRTPWALASGRFWPGTVPGILNVFPIALNSRNRFKLQKFVETCRKV